jgi:hypothetical protein
LIGIFLWRFRKETKCGGEEETPGKRRGNKKIYYVVEKTRHLRMMSEKKYI